MSIAIRVEGLAELRRAFARLEPELRGSLREELRAAAEIVATEGRSQAESKGLHESGRLIARIRPGVRGSTAVVRDDAQRTTGANAPFSYPRLWEFGRGRPFLQPALEAKEPEVLSRVERMLDRLADGF